MNEHYVIHWLYRRNLEDVSRFVGEKTIKSKTENDDETYLHSGNQT